MTGITDITDITDITEHLHTNADHRQKTRIQLFQINGISTDSQEPTDTPTR
jgi:hypothetical protein